MIYKGTRFFSFLHHQITMSLLWLSLIAGIWLHSINGTNSTFPAYSSELKRILSMSPLQLNILAHASHAGKLLGWISGVAAARLPLWLVLLVGSALGAAGYGVQYLFLTGRIRSLSYRQVFSLTVLAGNSTCWINTAAHVLAIRNFPLHRQIAVGISTSYAGLSEMIYAAAVSVAAADPSSPLDRAATLLLLHSVLPLVVSVAAVLLVRWANVGGRPRRLAVGFVMLFMITVFTRCFVEVTSFIPEVLPAAAALVCVIVLLMLPLVVLAVEVAEMIVVHDEEGLNRLELAGEEIERNEIPPLLMLRKLEFWLYFWAYFFGATLGYFYMNNLEQIAESRACSDISSLVLLSSAFVFVGRLLPSLLDYIFHKSKRAVSRATLMGVMTALMCVAFFLLGISKHDFALYTGTAVISVCTGAITSISVSLTTELFGTANFGVNHNILLCNIPIGSFLFGNLAKLIDQRGRLGGEEKCIGHKCHQVSLLVLSFLSVLGSWLALVLGEKTKNLHAADGV